MYTDKRQSASTARTNRKQDPDYLQGVTYNAPMYKPFTAFIGLRYVCAKRGNHFISFITMISIAGVAVGIMAIIAVLSVMNGFRQELTERTLGMISHATVVQYDEEFKDWKQIAGRIAAHPEVVGVAPYIRKEAMLTHNRRVQGAIIRGVLPEAEPTVSDVAEKMRSGSLKALQGGEFGIVLGKELADALAVLVGDKLTLLAPQARMTPAGMLPRLKRFTVKGIFEIGMHEYDSALALIHLDDAGKLFRLDAPAGLRIKTSDVIAAPYIAREVMQRIPGRYGVIDWTQQNRNFFRALKTEKIVMFVITILIIAVAAFNIISTLIMVVTDKQADIAVLRTLGASPKSIMQIFMLQGIVIGVAGAVLGGILGVALASHLPTIVRLVEGLFKVDLLPCDVYYICDFPSKVEMLDVVLVSIVAFLLCVLATIYPARRAASTQPAEALKYE